MQDLSIEKIDALRAAIEAATTVQELKSILDVASGYQVYIKQARKNREAELKIAEYMIRTERKLGELLLAAKAIGQITHAHGNQYKRVILSGNNPLKLNEIGITPKLSMRSQHIASVPADEFEMVIRNAKEAGKLSRNLFLVKPSKPHQAKPKILASDGAQSEVVREELSLTAQQKVDRAIKLLAEKLQGDFDRAVKAKVDEVLGNTIARLRREQDEAKRIFASRKGIMNRKEYNQIRACLHTDRTASDSEKREAFILFTSFEKYLLKEKDSPTEFSAIPPLPTDVAAWSAWRQKTSEARKRGSKKDPPDSITTK